MKRISIALFLICSLLAFTGCGGGGMKSKAGHLNLALWWFGETLDPAHAWDGWTLTRIGAGETLVAVNEHMEFVPQLADKWEHINATTWRFHIRPNVKFQDGTPMTPELVKASLERTMQENDRAKKALHAKEIRVDGENIVIETEEPNASLISALSDPLFIIVNTQADMSKVASTPVLTGPYAITEWKKGSEIQMKRNEYYWDGKPGLDTVTVKLFEDDTSRAMALQSGEIDLMQRMTEANRSLFADKPDYTIYETTGVRVFMVTPYQGDGIFTDKNLRKALAYMLDNDALAKSYGNSVAAGEPFPPSVPYGHTGQKVTYDPAKSEALFAAAGWKKNAQGMYEKDGKPLTLRFATWGTKTTLYEAIESQLRAGGIDVKMVHVQEPDKVDEVGGFDLLEEDWSVATTNDPYPWLRGMLYSKSGKNTNHSRYASPAFDAIIDEMATALDPAQKDALVMKAAQQIMEDQPSIYLIVPTTTVVGKSNVKNVKIFPLDYYLLTKDITVE